MAGAIPASSLSLLPLPKALQIVSTNILWMYYSYMYLILISRFEEVIMESERINIIVVGMPYLIYIWSNMYSILFTYTYTRVRLCVCMWSD